MIWRNVACCTLRSNRLLQQGVILLRAYTKEETDRNCYLPGVQKYCEEVYNQCVIEGFSGVFRFKEGIRYG